MSLEAKLEIIVKSTSNRQCRLVAKWMAFLTFFLNCSARSRRDDCFLNGGH